MTDDYELCNICGCLRNFSEENEELQQKYGKCICIFCERCGKKTNFGYYLCNTCDDLYG